MIALLAQHFNPCSPASGGAPSAADRPQAVGGLSLPSDRLEIMRVLNDRREIAAAEGTELGVSEWVQVTQERINFFADATGDRQWIHIDPERAMEGPFGSTVAHGYLTLSMLPFLSAQVFAFAGDVARVNYGINRVRFITPVVVNSKVRNRVEMLKVRDMAKGQQVTLRHTIEIKGSDKPACVAETVTLLMDADS
jgi:acyl dehydratase